MQRPGTCGALSRSDANAAILVQPRRAMCRFRMSTSGMMRPVPRRPAPPIAAVISFIDCINRGDLEALTALMDEEHTLRVLAEEPLVGREANVRAWRGYFTAFPNYVIYPRQITADGEHVTVV